MAAYKMTAADRRALANIQARERQQKARRSVVSNPQAVGNSADASKSGNPILKGIGTISDIGRNVNQGAFKSVEGIVDLGAGIVGAVGGLFSDDFENDVKKFVETDWTGKYLDELGVVTSLSGGIGGLIGGVAAYKLKPWENSYLKEGGMIEQVAQGVGQMLPAVAVTIATGGLGAGAAAGGTATASGGASAVLGNAAKAVGNYAVKNAGMLTIGASAAGTSTEEAFKDGASYGAGLGYGAVSGLTEMATERLLPGPADNVIGKGLLGGVRKRVATQGVKRVVGQVAKEALGEATEEMVSEITNPLRKSIYKGVEAFDEYGDLDFYKGVGEAGLVGGLTSMAYGGTVGKAMQGKGYNGDIDASIEAIEALKEERSKIQEKSKDGKLSPEDDKRISNLIDENYKQIERVLKAKGVENMSDTIERYELDLDFDESGNYVKSEADTAGLDGGYYSADARGQEVSIREVLDEQGVTAYKGELTAEETEAWKEVLRAHNKMNKLGHVGKNVVIVDEMSDSNAFIDENVIVIGKDMLTKGEHIKRLVHETTHFTEGSNEWKALTQYIFGDGKNIRQTLKAEIAEVIGHGYGATDADVDAVSEYFGSGYKTQLTKEQRVLIEEVIANRMGNIFSDNAAVEHLCREKPTLAKRIWERIKAVLNSIGKTSAEREEIKKLRETERLFRAALKTGGQSYIAEKLYNEATSGIHFSRKITSSGEAFALIEQDSINKLQKYPGDSLQAKVRNYIKQFRGTVLPLGTTDNAYMRREAEGEYTNPAKAMSEDAYNDKLKAASEFSNLLSCGSYIRHDSDNGRHPDAVRGWNYYKIQYVVPTDDGGYRAYKGEIQIKLIARGDCFYDITKIEDITNGTAGQALIQAAGSVSTSSNTIIPQNPKKSTGSVKKSGKIQSDGVLSKADQRLLFDEEFYERYEAESRERITETVEELEEIKNSQAFAEMSEDEAYDINTKLKVLSAGYDTVYDYYVERAKNSIIEEYARDEERGREGRIHRRLKEKRAQAEKERALQRDISEASEHKNAQFEIIQATNPMYDDFHTGIRSPRDIKGFAEVIDDPDSFTWGDFSRDDAQKALEQGKVTVYSSYPIKNGVFVSTSYRQALNYAGGEPSGVHSKLVPLDNVAWINGDEGQFAKVGKVKRSGKAESAEDYQSAEPYSYDYLVSQDDMEVATLPEIADVVDKNGKIIRGDIIDLGIKNAEQIGSSSNGIILIENNYSHRKYRITVESIRHSLGGDRNRLLTNARVSSIIGEVIKNGIPINALYNTADIAVGTYAIATLLKDSDGNEFVAISTIEERTNEVLAVEKYDVAHSVSARPKNNGNAWSGNKPQGKNPPTSNTVDTISISHFLNIVNSTYQSILSDDVLKHLGITRNPQGYYSNRVRFSHKPEHHEGDISAEEMSSVLGLADDWNAFQAKKNAEAEAAEFAELVDLTTPPSIPHNAPISNAEHARQLREQYFPGLDDGQFFAAIAKMTKDKVYSIDDANSVVGDIIASLVHGDVRGKLLGERAIAERVWQLYNASGRRVTDEAGYTLADIILEKTVIADNLKRKGVEAAATTLEAVRTLQHQLDLGDIKSQIKEKFGNKNSISLIWSKKEGGLSLTEAVELLKSEGIEVKSTEPIDIISEINEIYNESRSAVEKAENERFTDIMSEDELNTVREDIVRKLREGYRDLGSRSALVKFENEHRAEVKKLKEKRNELMKMMALEYTKSIQEYKYKVKENDIRNRIVSLTQWFTDQKNGAFFNATQYKNNLFQRSIDKLGGITRNGNLSDKITRSVFAQLREWYSKENPMIYTEGTPEEHQIYKQHIADMIQSVCEGEGKFTIAQLNTISNLLDYFKHMVNKYGKAYIDGKYVEIAPQAEEFVRVIEEKNKVPDMRLTKLFTKYRETFDDPMSLFRLMDGYQEGYFTSLGNSLRDGLIKSDHWKMLIYKKVDAFWDEHKGFNKDLAKKTVKYTVGDNTYEIPLNQAMYLYMTMNREDAFAGHVLSGFEYKDKKGVYHNVEGLVTEGNLPDEYTEDDIKAIVKKARGKLYSEFNETEKLFIYIVEGVFNNECKQAKADTDLKRDGFTHVKSGYYCPVSIANMAHQIDGNNMFFNYDLGNFSFNKSTEKGSKHQIRIMPLTEVFDKHVQQVAIYAHLALIADSYTRIFNLDIGGNKNVVKSVRSELKNVWEDGEKYVRELFEDLKGHPSKTPKILQELRRGHAVSAIGGNIKVLATQFSSVLASVNVLDMDCIAKGVTVKGKGNVDKYCDLAELRNYENSAAMAQANIDRKASAVRGKVDKIGDTLMKPVGFMDRKVVEWLFGACQLQIERNGGAKVGTEENKIEAGKLLKKVILETQQNSMLTERSKAMRSDNIILQTFTMFRADAMKVICRFFDAYGAAHYAKHRLQTAKKNGADEAEIKRLENELKKDHEMEARAIGGLVMTSVYMYLIGLLFKWLYNRLDDEYEEKNAPLIAQDAATQIIGNMIGGLPIVSDLYTKITDGYDIDNYAYSAVNDLMDTTMSLVDSLKDGDPRNTGKKLRNISYSVGQVLGVPVRNIYNTLYGLTKRAVPEAAYNWDSILGAQSYSSDLKKAIAKDDEGMIATIAGLMLDENAGYVNDKSLRIEMRKLLGEGHDVLPRSVGESVTHNGEQITLTKRQKSRFSALYSVAGERAAKLVKTSLYRRADDTVKSSAIRFIYDTYYNLALQEVVGEELEGKNVLFAEAMDIEQLAIIVAYARSIEADKDRSGNSIAGSKKAKIERYIQSLGISAAEKYMMMGYLGYKCTNGASAVKGYINRLPLTKAEKERLYEYCGYAA